MTTEGRGFGQWGWKNDTLSRDSDRRGGVAQKGVVSAQLFRFHSFDLRFSALKKWERDAQRQEEWARAIPPDPVRVC